MYGLPQSTEVNRVLPKNKVVEKFGLTGKDRSMFETKIHRIVISNEVSGRTTNLTVGDITGFFILRVELSEMVSNTFEGCVKENYLRNDWMTDEAERLIESDFSNPLRAISILHAGLKPRYLLFSISGFDDDLLDLNDPSVRLIGPEVIFGYSDHPVL